MHDSRACCDAPRWSGSCTRLTPVGLRSDEVQHPHGPGDCRCPLVGSCWLQRSAEAAVHWTDATERREEQVLTSMTCELGATGMLTPLLCIHEGAGADLGLALDTSDFRF